MGAPRQLSKSCHSERSEESVPFLPPAGGVAAESSDSVIGDVIEDGSCCHIFISENVSQRTVPDDREPSLMTHVFGNTKVPSPCVPISESTPD